MNENEINKTADTSSKEYHGLLYLLKLTWQLKYWILLTIAVLVVAAFFILKTLTPQYERQLTLRIEPQQSLCEQDTCPHDLLLSQVTLRDETEPIRAQLQSSSMMDSAEILSHLEGQLSMERNSISASSFSKSSHIIYLKCKTENPENADAFLKALVESYNQYAIQKEQERISTMISACDEMINLLAQNSTLSIDSLNEIQAFIYSKIKDDNCTDLLINELKKEKAEYLAEYLQIAPELTTVDIPYSEATIYPKTKFFYLLAVVLGFFLPLLVAEIIYSRKNRKFAA